jgi:hypothetical protein
MTPATQSPSVSSNNVQPSQGPVVPDAPSVATPPVTLSASNTPTPPSVPTDPLVTMEATPPTVESPSDSKFDLEVLNSYGI